MLSSLATIALTLSLVSDSARLLHSSTGDDASRVGNWVLGAEAVTVYTTSTGTNTALGAAFTSYPAYDTTTLTPPDVPQPPSTGFDVVMPANGDDLVSQGFELSVTQSGNFLGFSIELSVSNSIMGDSANTLKTPFINYMANIRNRAGKGAVVRVGGNSQEDSTLFMNGFSGTTDVIEKIKVTTSTTPIINYSEGLFYVMQNITELVGVNWYFGLAFNASDAFYADPNVVLVAETAQQVLGDSLLGLQLGNEPDQYSGNGRRNDTFTLGDYVYEFESVKQEILSEATLSNSQFLVGPGICCDVSGFELDDVFNAGWLTDNSANLAKVAVQHYPNNNCQLNGVVIDAQDIFSDYLNHTSATNLTVPYLAGTATATDAGLEMIMFETNTASCGGFQGLSDSFGAALWMADYAFQMAYRNFTGALMHVGGQSVYYNPFTPPPSGQSADYQWTTGSVYYSSLLVAETFGSSDVAQIVDLNVNGGNIYTPGYGIYENDAPVRMVLFNYVTDSSGASDYEAVISINGASLPSGNVTVRYLQANSTAEKYNITWAGQTLGPSFDSDGTLFNSQTEVSIACDTTANTCTIPVYAPSVALVFLTTTSLEEIAAPAGATTTFATTATGLATATVDQAVLATSNGQMGNGDGSLIGSTSEQSAYTSKATSMFGAGVGVLTATAALAGLLVATRMW